MAESKSRGKTKGKAAAPAVPAAPTTSAPPTSPAATSPAATSPAATSPAATSPAATSPGATSPGATSPAATSPPTPQTWLQRNGRGALAAILSGVLLGLSQPVVIESFGDEPIDPTGLSGMLALVGFVPVLLALRGAGPKKAYWLGFLASFVQFTITVQWLVVAMVVFGRIPLLASWAILALLTSALAAYVAAAYAVTRMIVGRVWWGRRVPMWLAFPVCLCAAELLRNFGPLGGFPWGNVGMSFATVPLLLQAASLVGVYGLVFLAGLASSTIAELVAWRWDPLRTRARTADGASGSIVAARARDSDERRPMPRRALLVGGVVVALWIVFGAVRLATYDVGDAHVVKVALLQGNIEQGIRNNEPWTGRTILGRYHTQTEDALAQGAQLIVWPEAAFPLRLRRDVKSMLEQRLVRVDGTAPAAAVVGAVAYESVVDEDGKRKEVRSNSAFIVGENLEVKGRVDKTHLVPFGEYVPWPLGAIVRQIVPIGGTEPGSSYQSFPLSLADARTGAKRDVKIGATICYEGIFPEIARALKHAGTELHVNVTNDGWYGISGAATQHLLFYAMRAVESGTPVVRAANTGKSGWADNRGRLHDVTPIYVDRAVVADVAIATTNTLYAAVGEWLALPCALLALFGWFASMLGLDALKRKRAAADLVLGIAGALVAVAGTVVYFAGHDFDESRATRFLLLVLAGLLVGAGALSGRPWGRKAQLVTGVLALVCCVAAASFGGGGVFLAVALAGLALFVVQLLRKHAYQRAPDPLVLDDS